MYPPVTQLETRHRMILDELRVREERRLARGSTSRSQRASALPMRLARLLKVAQAELRIKQLGAVLVAAAAMAVPAHAGGRAPSTTPLAGPWYTAQELEALKTYSAMSFAEKQAYLAGDTSQASTNVPLAGPAYTPDELKALVAYSDASFAEKKAILAGTTPAGAAEQTAFHWRDATIGGGVTLAAALALSALGAWAVRQRRGLRQA